MATPTSKRYRLVDNSGDDLQRLTYDFLRAAQQGCRVLLARQRGEFADADLPASEPLPAAWERKARHTSRVPKKSCLSDHSRATWSEINTTDALWTVPPERMKAGREHRVPLASSVTELLKGLPTSAEFLFPGRRAAMLSDMSLTLVLRRMGRGDITVHGFRSTFRDWCAEYASNTFSREVCEHALAHKLPDKVEAAYLPRTVIGTSGNVSDVTQAHALLHGEAQRLALV